MFLRFMFKLRLLCFFYICQHQCDSTNKCVAVQHYKCTFCKLTVLCQFSFCKNNSCYYYRSTIIKQLKLHLVANGMFYLIFLDFRHLCSALPESQLYIPHPPTTFYPPKHTTKPSASFHNKKAEFWNLTALGRVSNRHL